MKTINITLTRWQLSAVFFLIPAMIITSQKVYADDNNCGVSGGITAYVKADASIGGDGTKNRPYNSLSAAEGKNWTNLFVLSSNGVLDGGIKLKNGQNIVGNCQHNETYKIQNTNPNRLNGDAIVATGNNMIKGITIPTAVRIGINGQASKDLTVKCVTIKNTNTSLQQGGTRGLMFAAIDMAYTVNSGNTNISNVSIQNAPYGIALTTSGNAKRSYLVDSAKINDIISTNFNEADGIGVVVTNTSLQQGKVKNSMLSNIGVGGDGNGVIYFTMDTGRLPDTSVQNSTIASRNQFGAGINYAWDTIYDVSLPPENITIENNDLSNNFFSALLLSFAKDYKFNANIKNNKAINNPNALGGDTFVVLFLPAAGNRPNNNVATVNFENNVVANIAGEMFSIDNIIYNGAPSVTATIKNNRAKNVGAPFFAATGYNGDPAALSWNKFRLNATNNCTEASGDSNAWLGFKTGQIFYISVNGALPNDAQVVFHNNSFINPIDGNLFGLSYDSFFTNNWTADLSNNYWADGCPNNCVARDFKDAGAGGIVLGAANYKNAGPKSCNVPDYVNSP